MTMWKSSKKIVMPFLESDSDFSWLLSVLPTAESESSLSWAEILIEFYTQEFYSHETYYFQRVGNVRMYAELRTVHMYNSKQMQYTVNFLKFRRGLKLTSITAH